MTHEQKIDYMRIATSISNMGFEKHHLDLILSLYELVLAKEGETDLVSILRVQSEVEMREINRKVERSKQETTNNQ
jgi:hypothetical protein